MRQEINNIETNKEGEAQFTDALCAQEQGRHATGWTNKGKYARQNVSLLGRQSRPAVEG